MVTPPILDNKHTSSPSMFAPSVLLREARRQKHLKAVDVPDVCILDPDGDLVRTLRLAGKTQRFDGWPCYHTELDRFPLGEREVGIIGRAVGSSFAVLVAEELFASGCRLLISLTSAGQIVPSGPPPFFVIIDRALRDEGTSYHYAPPAEFADADPRLIATASKALAAHSRAALSDQAGPRMPRSERPPKQSKPREAKAFLRSKWRPPPCTLSRMQRERGFFVLPM